MVGSTRCVIAGAHCNNWRVHKKSIRNNPTLALCSLTAFGKDTKLIYRHFATLYFVFAVDQAESELGILDLIQVFVEVRCLPVGRSSGVE